MAGADLDHVVRMMQYEMNDAADAETVGKTVYDCSSAQNIALLAIITELQAIRKVLERDA